MISLFEIFKLGIGPSSSHTVGPMKAAAAFADALRIAGLVAATKRLRVDFFGSLAWTGRGHASDKAVMLGLAGERPETVDPDHADQIIADIGQSRSLPLGGLKAIGFDPARDIVFDRMSETPRHPNTLRLRAFGDDDRLLSDERWCSIGGGFITREDDLDRAAGVAVDLPYPFADAAELLDMCARAGVSIAGIVEANELAARPAVEVDRHINLVIDTMMNAIDRGLRFDGELPGGLRVRRRAKMLLAKFEADRLKNQRPPHEIMDRISLFAIAVNEENAAGGRIVTAPTNGAAGVVPAVLRYYRDYCPGASDAGMRAFILTAAAVGALFKMNASISGAEVGCQGEVGVACSMAAAGLAAALGGSNEQIENAAEIGMEHHLGMTCDPIGGLVQIPCIERNAFGAVKAVNAASLALNGDGVHRVSLDQVIATMYQTGADMQSKYKETSQGGLAVNFTEC
ncbi:L-serine dehydratase 1 [Methylocella silvestris BL2]|uniref:L-serine dehydratase n=1 Tax=Methylocella silvestris (strain DSM 15510 / CIP 108128 / LMG 27833 / NCIMB 13906 / BL2) TaxID=395965 RepID=B8ELW7_METSB|nr:L-serine ammonia-lyase [Methylocella silvestris]ACK50748.1 L-serine dehydratase 1 [Methylocella silvestris BL2]